MISQSRFILKSQKDRNQVVEYLQQIKIKSDALMNYFLGGYFLTGTLIAGFYDTWGIAFLSGGFLLAIYYISKYFVRNSDLYQYVLSTVLGLFLIQYTFQTNNMPEMHFTAFISSAVLITYQKWKLQIPLLTVLISHDALLVYLQYSGLKDVYFSELTDVNMQTFSIHVFFELVIIFLCALWSFHFQKYSTDYMQLNFEAGKLQAELLHREKIMHMSDQLNKISEKLNESEELSHTGNWERNFVNNIMIWSDEMYRIFEIQKTGFNISYDGFMSFVHPDDRLLIEEIIKKYRTDHQPFNYLCRIKTQKGVQKIISVHGKVMVNEKNEVIKTYGITRDITEYKINGEPVTKLNEFQAN